MRRPSWSNAGLEATFAESEETAKKRAGGKLYVTYDIARQFARLRCRGRRDQRRVRRPDHLPPEPFMTGKTGNWAATGGTEGGVAPGGRRARPRANHCCHSSLVQRLILPSNAASGRLFRAPSSVSRSARAGLPRDWHNGISAGRTGRAGSRRGRGRSPPDRCRYRALPGKAPARSGTLR